VLQEDGQIEEYFRETVDETLDWFNSNLTNPRIDEEDRNCVFWFCAKRQQCIARLWELVAILVENQIEVHRICTNDPGIIVYRDEFQVAAIPNQRTTYTLRV
jgi:hypothetical protein